MASDHEINPSPLSEDPESYAQAGPSVPTVAQSMSGHLIKAINLDTIFQLLQETSRTQEHAMRVLQGRLDTQETALKLLQESMASLTRANDSPHPSKERADDPGNKSLWYSRLPKIRVLFANEEEPALLRQQSYDKFLSRVHGFGPPFDSINAYNVTQTEERRCLELYTIDLLALEKLNQQKTLEGLVSKLGLSEDSIPQLGDYVVWIQVHTPDQTHRSHMCKISREHQDHLMSWKTTTGLPISKTSYRDGKLLWHFNTLRAAASACAVYLSISGLIGRAVPHDLRAIHMFCHHCGRPGHMKNEGTKTCTKLPKCRPPTHREDSRTSPCLICATQHEKNPPSQRCNRKPRCLNCGGDHGTLWRQCEDSDVKEHRAECGKYRKTPWWAEHLSIPEVPHFPERKPKPPKSSAKKTQQTSPEQSYTNTWPSQPGVQLNPDGANVGVTQGNTDTPRDCGRPMTPIELNDDGDNGPSASMTSKAPSKKEAWDAIMGKKREESKRQADSRPPTLKRPRGRPRKNSAQASPTSPQGSPSKRPRKQYNMTRSQSQGLETIDRYDGGSRENISYGISSSAPLQSMDRFSPSSRVNIPWFERIPDNATVKPADVTAAAQFQSTRNATVHDRKGKAVCSAISELRQFVARTSAAAVPSVHVSDDDDDDWEDEEEDE